MDYFVSVENIPYHRWQLELLIESFKIHGLQDKLLVAVVENNTPQFSGFTKNLMEHERKFAHNDYGESKGCKRLNKPYALLAALSNNLLQQPFAVLHPDMLLCKPLEEKGPPNFYFSVEQEDTDLRRRLRPYLKKILAERVEDVDALPWLNASGFCAFNNVSALFFARVMYYMEKFQTDHLDWEDSPKAAWVTAMYEQYNLALLQGRFYEATMLNNIEDIPNASVIHYKYGVPPFFNKKHFMFKDALQFTLNASDPLDVLEQYDITTSMQFMGRVIQSYKSTKSPESIKSDVTSASQRQITPMKIPSELIEPKA